MKNKKLRARLKLPEKQKEFVEIPISNRNDEVFLVDKEFQEQFENHNWYLRSRKSTIPKNPKPFYFRKEWEFLQTNMRVEGKRVTMSAQKYLFMISGRYRKGLILKPSNKDFTDLRIGNWGNGASRKGYYRSLYGRSKYEKRVGVRKTPREKFFNLEKYLETCTAEEEKRINYLIRLNKNYTLWLEQDAIMKASLKAQEAKKRAIEDNKKWA